MEGKGHDFIPLQRKTLRLQGILTVIIIIFILTGIIGFVWVFFIESIKIVLLDECLKTRKNCYIVTILLLLCIHITQVKNCNCFKVKPKFPKIEQALREMLPRKKTFGARSPRSLLFSSKSSGFFSEMLTGLRQRQQRTS